jgi:hypothetical protein
MPVYPAAAGGLLKDVFYKETNLPASDALTVQVWDGDPDAAGDLLVEERISLPWLVTVLSDNYSARGDNPAVISLGPAGSGGWSATHVRVLAGDAGSEVPVCKSAMAGGTLTVPEGYFVNMPAAALGSILSWPQGDSGSGAVPHVKAAAVIIVHAYGGTNEIRSASGFVVELWDHDPLHVAHGSPFTSIAVARDNTEWTYTPGPPAEMENANAIVSAAAPSGGWTWEYTTLRIAGGTAFLLKTSTIGGGATIAAGNTATIAAGAIHFTLNAA